MPRKKYNPAIASTHKTAVFQIHNPSAKKRRVLDTALRHNHLAYSKLLPIALAETDRIAKISGENPYKTNKQRIDAVKKLVNEQIIKLQQSEAAKIGLQIGLAAKAGLQEDVADTIAAYLALLDKYKNDCAAEAKKPEEKRKELSKPGIPTFAKLQFIAHDHEAAYEDLKNSRTLEEENQARDNVLRSDKAGLTRPILFLKNRISDGFLILFDETKNRYLIYLNLFGKNSRFAEKISLRGLVDIRSGEIMTKTNQTGLLFPIKFSDKFQFQEFLDRAGQKQKFNREVQSASAKLMHRHGRYEVHVAFQFETPNIEPTTLLGVDRGIYNLAAFCVIDDVGNIVAEDLFSGEDLRDVQQKEERRQSKTQKRGKIYRATTRRAESDRAVYMTANKIAAMAAKHKSQVVLENLSNLTKRTSKRGRSNFNRLLTRVQYSKLQQVLDYKLKLHGLPKSVSVAPQGTSQTCPECGTWNPENRLKKPSPDGKKFAMDVFLCVKCNYRHDADLNAARVIALKKKWRKELPPSKQKKFAKDLSDTDFSFGRCLTSLKEKRNTER